jgi:hypothetical protein
VRNVVLALRFWDYNFICPVFVIRLALVPNKKKMEIPLFTCCYLWVALCTLTKGQIRSQHYTVDPSLDNKVSNTSVLAEHQSQSLIECTAKCGDRCSCFGFNIQSRKCRIHQTCEPSVMTTDESGWRYYSPAGMLSYIPYISKLKILSYFRVCVIPLVFIWFIPSSFTYYTHLYLKLKTLQSNLPSMHCKTDKCTRSLDFTMTIP